MQIVQSLQYPEFPKHMVNYQPVKIRKYFIYDIYAILPLSENDE